MAAIHLGIDFDNTVVRYDGVFYKYALKHRLISKRIQRNKQKIRDSIRMLPAGNDRWTKLQALVYGYHMDEAKPAKGIEEFLLKCKEKSIKVSIISHKTVYPALGPSVNLRYAARQWLKDKGFLSILGLSTSDIKFVGTLDDKLSQIVKLKCTHFIDDLKEVLLHPNFPRKVERMLYAPRRENNAPKNIQQFKSWDKIQEYLFEL